MNFPIKSEGVKIIPITIKEYEEKCPKTFTYFKEKGCSSIILNKGFITLTDSRNGFSLTYDFLDMEFFEKYL